MPIDPTSAALRSALREPKVSRSDYQARARTYRPAYAALRAQLAEIEALAAEVEESETDPAILSFLRHDLASTLTAIDRQVAKASKAARTLSQSVELLYERDVPRLLALMDEAEANDV